MPTLYIRQSCALVTYSNYSMLFLRLMSILAHRTSTKFVFNVICLKLSNYQAEHVSGGKAIPHSPLKPISVTLPPRSIPTPWPPRWSRLHRFLSRPPTSPLHSGQSRIQEMAELYSASNHTWQPKILTTILVTVLFSWPYDLFLVIICCVFVPLLSFPLWQSSGAHLCKKYRWWRGAPPMTTAAPPDFRLTLLCFTLCSHALLSR